MVKIRIHKDKLTEWREATFAYLLKSGIKATLDDRLYGAKCKDGIRFPGKED